MTQNVIALNAYKIQYSVYKSTIYSGQSSAAGVEGGSPMTVQSPDFQLSGYQTTVMGNLYAA